MLIRPEPVAQDDDAPAAPDRGPWTGVVEVMGPAGAGKSSLVRAMERLDPRIRAWAGVSRAAWLPFALARAGRLLPSWVLRGRRDRWFTWNEVKSLAFLDAWLGPVRRRRGGEAIVVDHGPLYRLARLEEFGPAIVGSPDFRRWWRRRLEAWLGALDLVVVLDAPDPVLLERVDRRGHWYLSAAGSEEERREFLRRYRGAFERVLAAAGSDGPGILRLRSDLATPERLAARVLREVRGRPRGVVRR